MEKFSICNMSNINFLFVLIWLAIAIDESLQDPLSKRLFKRSYKDSPYCRDCEHDCRDRDRVRERELTGIDYVCAKRVYSDEFKTFESLCLLKCHNECTRGERDDFKFEYEGECRRHYNGPREYEDRREHEDRREDEDRTDAKVVHDNARHTSIPTCAKARECYCGTVCRPICARSPDSAPLYAVFDNPCRLSCTNRCFDEGRGYEPTENYLCRNEVRLHKCEFGIKQG